MVLWRFVAAILGCLVVGCAAGPEVAGDRSAVYGVVVARAHSEVLEKWAQASNNPYESTPGGAVRGPAEAIDYGSLTGIYVGLVDPAFSGGAIHDIAFSKAGAKPESLAVAVGDVIRVRNDTAGPVTFFLAATEGEAIQDIPVLPAGRAATIRVRLEGLLELGVDEDERLVAPVLARRGLRTSKVVSGGNYVFNNLEPGEYEMTFWYWRLGSLERSVKLVAGRASRVDEVLAVDRTVR
jgi:hypothetical protein